MDFMTTILGGSGIIGLIITLVKMGYLNIKIGKNGNGSNGMRELKEAIEKMGGNDLQHIQKGIDELQNGQIKMIELLTRIDTRLQDLLNKK